MCDEFGESLTEESLTTAKSTAAACAATVAEATILAACMKGSVLNRSAASKKLQSCWASVGKHRDMFGVNVQGLMHPVLVAVATERALG